MSELERQPVEGVIVTTYVDRGEAEQDMQRAFELVEQAAAGLQAGEALLTKLELGEAYKVLGYNSHIELLADGQRKYLRTQLHPVVRQRLAVQMYTGDKATQREIAAALGVSHVTIGRDLREASEAGIIKDEPRRRRAEPPRPRDGEQEDGPQPEAPQDAAPAPAAKSRRPDLLKVFKDHTFELGRRSRILRDLREDDRYAGRLEDLKYTRGDLETARDVINLILEDFQG